METEETIDLRAVFAVLRRQLRLIIVTGALVVGLAVFYIASTTPIYTASALIYVDTSKKDILTSEGAANLSGAAENSRIDSEVEILRSPTVMIETMNRADLVSDPEFGPKLGLLSKIKLALGMTVNTPSDPSAIVAGTLNRLQNATSARRRGQTYLISVSAKSEDAAKAALIANTMARAYIDLQVASKSQAALASRDVIQNQIEGARAQLEASEESFDGFIEDNLTRLEQEVGSARFAELQAQLVEAREGTLGAESRITEARAAIDSGNWEEVVASLESDAIQALEAQRQTLLRRLDGTDTTSEVAVNLRAGLSQIEEQLSAQATAVVSALQSEVAGLRDQSSELRGQLRAEVLASDLSPQTLAEIYSLQQEADIAQRQYRTLLSRMRDLEAQALVQVADSRLVSEALPPTRPGEPNAKLILAMAGVVALGAGIGLALLNEFFVGGVTAVRQLANIVPVPVAGAIPKTDFSAVQHSVADLVVDEPMSSFSESLRRVRATIDQTLRPKGNKCNVIMVTSAISGEGKSSLSLALTRTYATAGKDVLLIDADLRKPAQYKQINHEPGQGFLDYLASPASMGQDDPSFYVSDPKTRAGVILGKGRADVPTDQLLQTTAFEALVENARETMDAVIIDTPPMVPVVDARYVAPRADAIILVIRYGLTSQGDVRDAYAQLREAAGNEVPIFTVLNLDETRSSDYGYYSYRG